MPRKTMDPIVFGVLPDIPTTGPDSFGDGQSLVSWISGDDGVTLDGSNMESVVDNAALALGALWTASVDYTPSSLLNGMQRWNCAAADQWLTRSDSGPVVFTGFVMAFYIRMFTTSGIDRVPYGINTVDKEDALGAISTDYLQDEYFMGDGVSANAITIGGASQTNNISYVVVVTYDRTTGEVRCYRDGVDITEVTPHNPGSGLIFQYNYAWAVSKGNAGLWNCGQNLLYDTAPTLTLVNQAGQWIDDHYALGATWSLS